MLQRFSQFAMSVGRARRCGHLYFTPMKSILRDRTSRPLLLAFGIAALVGCANKDLVSRSGGADAATQALRAEIDTILATYAQNAAFVNLYSNFPCRRGRRQTVAAAGTRLP